MAAPHVTRHECLCQKHFHPTIHLLSVKMATQTWPCTRESRVALIPLKFNDFSDTIRFLKTVSRWRIIDVSPNTVGMNGRSSGVASSLSCITSNINLLKCFRSFRMSEEWEEFTLLGEDVKTWRAYSQSCQLTCGVAAPPPIWSCFSDTSFTSSESSGVRVRVNSSRFSERF